MLLNAGIYAFTVIECESHRDFHVVCFDGDDCQNHGQAFRLLQPNGLIAM